MPDVNELTLLPLDASVIARLVELGEATGQDLMGQLVPLFLADADVRIADLREAVRSRDAHTVARTAHTLSGAAANLGATNLALLCATLSTPSAAGDPASSKPLFDRIEAELLRVRSALSLLVAPR